MHKQGLVQRQPLKNVFCSSPQWNGFGWEVKIFIRMWTIHSDGIIAAICFRGARIRDGRLGRWNQMVRDDQLLCKTSMDGRAVIADECAKRHQEDS